MKVEKPIIVLTPGDPEGIGPEITWKMIRSLGARYPVRILCVGAEAPFRKLRAPIVHYHPAAPVSEIPSFGSKPFIWLLPAPEIAPPGRFLEGFQAGWSIESATRLVQNGTASALVTGPISKERLQKGGYLYPGHTEFLASLCNTDQVTMMLANSILKVSLVTTHLALHEVPSALTREKIRCAIQQTADGLKQYWGISRPKIAVTALNPHGGEAGLFGSEEMKIISPEIISLQSKQAGNFELTGPFPADTLFAKHFLASKKNRFDAVVCMYHDQGLIPVKLLDFHNTVNVTLGLPMIRTSVDHGVGFDIVGKGVADPSSLFAAVKLATHFIVQNRKRHRLLRKKLK